MEDVTKQTLIDLTIESMHRNIERLEEGGINCVAYPFPRSRKHFPGIERAQDINILAQTKVGKTQFVSDVCIFEPLYELYYGKYDFRYNVIYWALEETRERIVQRYMSWLLYRESGGKVRVSPSQLRSTLVPCPQEALDMLADEHIRDMLDFFDQHVIFPVETPNPTGIYNWCRRWAEQRGTRYEREIEIEDEFGEKTTKKVFDHYVPDDPDAFNVVIIDPINRIDSERGMDERLALKKLSEYCAKYLRNDYFFTTVLVQQANFQSYSLDASKVKRFEPTVGDGGGSKEISQDFDVQLALYCPANYDVDSYLGYDIKRLHKRGLFARCTINRNGEAGGITPLFFDGAVSQFWELPLPKSTGEMTAVYNYCDQMSLPHTSEELANLNPFIKKHTPPKQEEQPQKINFINLLFRGH